MAASPITSWQIEGEKVRSVIFLASKIIVVIAAMKLRHLLLERKAMTNLDSIIKSRDITLPTKVQSQSYSFSSSQIRIWELDHKKAWELKNLRFQIVVLDLESPLDSKELKPVDPKGNQPWMFTRTDAEPSILWPPDAKSWLIRKDPDAGKDWGQEEKRAAEVEMVR